MPKEQTLDYPTICSIVGRLFLESQFEVEKLRREGVANTSYLSSELQNKVKEIEQLKSQLNTAQECIVHLEKEKDLDNDDSRT